MVVGFEEFSRKTQRYMELAEKIDLHVVDQHRSVVWCIHCRNGSLWDRLAEGLSGILGDTTLPRMPLQDCVLKEVVNHSRENEIPYA